MTTKEHTAVRLDEKTLIRIDAIRPLLDTQWRQATRSDVLRLLIINALEHFEKEHQAELGALRKRGRPGAKAPAKPARRPTKKTPPSAD